MNRIDTENQRLDEDYVYVLMTAAYNEEANIEKTIQSVIAQSVLPKKWVIVSDGSFDRTDEIVQGYANKHAFIHFVRRTKPPGRSFGSKVIALQAASKILEDIAFDFIANLDADVSVGVSYFEDLVHQFENDPTLGLAGGYVCEEKNGEFKSRSSNRVYSVAHAGQMVRRECYQSIGGYAVLQYGGEDWHAQINAQMKGWGTKAFPDLIIYHHRHTGEGDNLIRHKFRQGRMDHSLGSDPFFEVLKCVQRLTEKPFFIGGIARLAGFSWSLVRREKRPVSDEFISFLRTEQRSKSSSLLNHARKLGRERN